MPLSREVMAPEEASGQCRNGKWNQELLRRIRNYWKESGIIEKNQELLPLLPLWLCSVYPLRDSDRELSMMPPRPDRMPQLKFQLQIFKPLKVIWKLWWIQWLKQLSAWRGLKHLEFITTKWRNQFRLTVGGAGLFALCCVPFLS
jgi:hypothetical protein